MTLPTAQPTLDSRASIREAVIAIHDTKGEDIVVRDLAGIADFADCFVLASGFNERQVQAIADRVEERLKEHGVRPLHVEGYQGGQWILLDYVDFLVHVFLDEKRRLYGLERLWSDAPDVTDEYRS